MKDKAVKTASPQKHLMTWAEARELARNLPPGSCYGVPRGGAVVAAMTGRAVDDPEDADYIVDDIVDSGRTRVRWSKLCPGKPFVALVDRRLNPEDKRWVVFPWERSADPESCDEGPEENVVRMLQFIGEDPDRDGLRDTPKRVVKAWKEMTAGYSQDPAVILKTGFDSHGYDEMVVCRNVEFFSNCEHHMLSFAGVAHVAYIPSPGGRVVGLSKMARLVDCFARRLQIQERLTRQVAEAMQEHLKPLGVGVVVKARHLCMSCRGVQKHQAEMVTTALLGAFLQPEVRAEFLSTCRD